MAGTLFEENPLQFRIPFPCALGHCAFKRANVGGTRSAEMRHENIVSPQCKIFDHLKGFCPNRSRPEVAQIVTQLPFCLFRHSPSRFLYGFRAIGFQLVVCSYCSTLFSLLNMEQVCKYIVLFVEHGTTCNCCESMLALCYLLCAVMGLTIEMVIVLRFTCWRGCQGCLSLSYW